MTPLQDHEKRRVKVPKHSENVSVKFNYRYKLLIVLYSHFELQSSSTGIREERKF